MTRAESLSPTLARVTSRDRGIGIRTDGIVEWDTPLRVSNASRIELDRGFRDYPGVDRDRASGG